MRNFPSDIRYVLPAIALVLFCLSCEIPTSVHISDGPSFSFHGSGRLASLRIYDPQPDHKIATPNDSKSVIWSIQPRSDNEESAFIERLSITYGEVPNGYVQTVPMTGIPPGLSSGRVYYFFAQTTRAPGKEGFFYLENTSPILIDVPGLCESGFTGDVKPLKCGTNEPFIDPKNLEEFVRNNRLN